MLGLQSRWQLMQMIKLSHGSVLAMDSTFATNKYGLPFFTLVCFDHHDMGLPAAWCIQQTETAEQISIFLAAVKDRACAIKPGWSPSCFIIDCASAEVSAIQQVFPRIPIYFCSWHVRRAWKENLILKVPNRAQLLDMSDDLGDLMYADSESDMYTAWEDFKAKYASEGTFLNYFQNTWMDRPGKPVTDSIPSACFEPEIYKDYLDTYHRYVLDPKLAWTLHSSTRDDIGYTETVELEFWKVLGSINVGDTLCLKFEDFSPNAPLRVQFGNPKEILHNDGFRDGDLCYVYQEKQDCLVVSELLWVKTICDKAGFVTYGTHKFVPSDIVVWQDVLSRLFAISFDEEQAGFKKIYSATGV